MCSKIWNFEMLDQHCQLISWFVGNRTVVDGRDGWARSVVDHDHCAINLPLKWVCIRVAWVVFPSWQIKTTHWLNWRHRQSTINTRALVLARSHVWLRPIPRWLLPNWRGVCCKTLWLQTFLSVPSNWNWILPHRSSPRVDQWKRQWTRRFPWQTIY